MKVKTQDLIGSALDWAVAKAEGATDSWREDGPFLWNGIPCVRNSGHDINYTPSTNGSVVMDFVFREVISIGGGGKENQGIWDAYKREFLFETDGRDCYMTGPTPLIAVCRCYVASKLGLEVEIPDELL
jgi:hypothetical protein